MANSNEWLVDLGAAANLGRPVVGAKAAALAELSAAGDDAWLTRPTRPYLPTRLSDASRGGTGGSLADSAKPCG